MKDIFSYRAYRSTRDVYPTWKVIFTTAAEAPLTSIFSDMSDDVDRHLLPAAILLIVRRNVHEKVLTQLRDSGASADDWRIDIDKVPLQVVSFDQDGSFSAIASVGEASTEVSEEQLRSLMHQGLRDIFVRRGALIQAEDGQHFIHPSGKHSQAFIRAANTLVDGPETMFIASCLLRHVPAPTRYLWVDTSSIGSLAQAFSFLRFQLAPELPVPTVSSFSSWKAISGGSIPRVQHRAALISATTSGNLARRLVSDQSFKAEEVITLFSFAKTPTDPVVCDLSEDPVIHRGRRVDTEYKEGRCALCDAQSRPIRFVGDQFLADAVRYDPVVIVRDDAPKGLREFMDAYHGHAGLGLRTAKDTGDSFRMVDIDPIRLSTTGRFKDKFNAAVERHAPRHLRALVHLDDEASEALATQFLTSAGFNPDRMIAAGSLQSRELDADAGGGVVVVAGKAGRGHDLDGISRDLRDPFGETPRTYLIGFTKHSHSDRWKQLTNNLRFNSRSARGKGYEHVVRALETMVLPDGDERTAWEGELGLLKGFRDDPDFLSATEQDQGTIDARIDDLQRGGILVTDRLFLPSPEGAQLALRDTFAFWDRNAARAVSQGDVVFTIASVLENLRFGSSPKLVSDPFVQRVIDPGMFGRYNDGVIQASLLRCALPHEIYYASTPSLSQQMADLVKRIFAATSPANEAGLEFLLALATGRLRLSAPDTREVAAAWSGTSHLGALLKRRISKKPVEELALP